MKSQYIVYAKRVRGVCRAYIYEAGRFVASAAGKTINQAIEKAYTAANCLSDAGDWMEDV